MRTTTKSKSADVLHVEAKIAELQRFISKQMSIKKSMRDVRMLKHAYEAIPRLEKWVEELLVIHEHNKSIAVTIKVYDNFSKSAQTMAEHIKEMGDSLGRVGTPMTLPSGQIVQIKEAVEALESRAWRKSQPDNLVISTLIDANTVKSFFEKEELRKTSEKLDHDLFDASAVKTGYRPRFILKPAQRIAQIKAELMQITNMVQSVYKHLDVLQNEYQAAGGRPIMSDPGDEMPNSHIQ